MRLCHETVTLVQADGEEYRCTALCGASFFAKTAIAPTPDGLKPMNTYKARIPDGVLPADIAPRVGDYLVRGVLGVCTRPADLQGYDYFHVTAVSDNRRGLHRHWGVDGA